jgi:hypothetical protein
VVPEATAAGGKNPHHTPDPKGRLSLLFRCR